jgi:membrane-bound lytic murein transglycosylase B
MQFNLTDGPPSTWDRYAVDRNHDGHQDVYDPADAIPWAANYLRALLRDAGGNLRHAILG